MKPLLLPFVLLVVLLAIAPGCVIHPPERAIGPTSTGAPDGEATFLPFPLGHEARCVQTGPGPFSHQGSQAYAVDFAMPVGSPVVAARDGIVVATKDDSDRGGPWRDYADLANYVRIQHADGTQGLYLHLMQHGVLVKVGQRVKRGQLIARSGNTGWSALPHLHFQLDARDRVTGRWHSIPFRFADVPGDGRPKMFLVYQSGNGPP